MNLLVLVSFLFFSVLFTFSCEYTPTSPPLFYALRAAFKKR